MIGMRIIKIDKKSKRDVSIFGDRIDHERI